MIYKKVIFIFLISFLIASICYSQKEAPPNMWQTIVLFITCDKNTIEFEHTQPQYMPMASPYEELKSGNFIIEIFDFKSNLLFKRNFQPEHCPGIIYVPYFLNISKIKLISPNGKTSELNVQGISVCNENKKCEPGEEELCPLDCKNANNSYYPLTPSNSDFYKIFKKPSRERPPLPLPIATTTAKQTYIKLIIYSILLFLIIFIIFAIIYRKKK
jgi:hypothetical protein